MTSLNVNAPTHLRVIGMTAEREAAHPDDLAARQSRLTAAMCQTFFRQLKLINAIMIELPLGWFAARAEPETMPDEPAELCEAVTIEIAPAPPTIELTPTSSPTPAESSVSEPEPAPAQQKEASEVLPARHNKPRKGKSSRSTPTA